MATLKVNLTKVGNACDQDATPPGAFPGPGWYVFLLDCNNAVFTHAGKEYGPFPVANGYVEIADVPPGRYVVMAMLNPFFTVPPHQAGLYHIQANYNSHFAVVDVCCGDRCRDVCVTLYNPGWHYCVQLLIPWLGHLVAMGKMDRKAGETAIGALEGVLRKGGKALPGDAAINGLVAEVTAAFEKDRTKGRAR